MWTPLGEGHYSAYHQEMLKYRLWSNTSLLCEEVKGQCILGFNIQQSGCQQFPVYTELGQILRNVLRHDVPASPRIFLSIISVKAGTPTPPVMLMGIYEYVLRPELLVYSPAIFFSLLYRSWFFHLWPFYMCVLLCLRLILTPASCPLLEASLPKDLVKGDQQVTVTGRMTFVASAFKRQNLFCMRSIMQLQVVGASSIRIIALMYLYPLYLMTHTLPSLTWLKE